MTFEKLYAWRDEARDAMALRRGVAPPRAVGTSGCKYEVLVCAGGACVSCGQAKVMQAFEHAIGKQGLADQVRLVATGCAGCCDLGAVVTIMPDHVLYQHVTPADVERIVANHLVGGQTVEDLLPRERDDSPPYRSPAEMPFFIHQQKIVLENSGLIDPEQIADYVACDGYLALARSLSELTPDEVITELTISGLRGRGGGGFAVGVKWRMLADAEGDRKYVICNADEGDPGAFMDRSVLESDPHRVLEGMIIAGYATGAAHGVVYVRAEYPLAIARLQRAIAQASEHALLGQRVLGSDFSFDVEIRVGAGAFVCGEETALIASVEGRRGNPRPRPPYPTESGLYGFPSMINNVESLANIPPIVRRGGAWFRAIGTESSSGTKVFALAGAIKHTGLVEVPMGTTLRTLVFDIGGGMPGEQTFKAAQTGGPSGGCIPAAHLDTPLDFDSLQAIGSIMGSGGLIVMAEDTCMVDVARFFMEFCLDESCGKCPPCRVGTHQLLRMLTAVCEGHAPDDQIERIEQLGAVVSKASLCGLGMTAPNPVMSTLRHFRADYDAHILEGRCPAKVCRQLLTFEIDPQACTGCSLCARSCPVETIFRVDNQKKYIIEQDPCIKCGGCFDVCRFDAVMKS